MFTRNQGVAQMKIDRFVREPECRQITGLSRATRWRLERANRFPKRRQISPNAVAWPLSEIIQWIEERAEADVRVAERAAERDDTDADGNDADGDDNAEVDDDAEAE